MSADPKSRPSFSTASRWSIAVDLAVRTLLVIAVVVMANYLSTQFFQRYYLSPQTQAGLSSRTLAVLQSLTNHVDVTLYFDRKAEIYPEVKALMEEYGVANRNIAITSVDYVRDGATAVQVQTKYRAYFANQSDKDLVIFDCGGRVKIVPGAALTSYTNTMTGIRQNPDNPRAPQLEWERRPISFNGEQAFTAVLLTLENPQPIEAYFVRGQNERALNDDGDFGFRSLATIFAENYIQVQNFDWLVNGVPADCNLLVIAGPEQPFKDQELKAISQYLREGGKLLVLVNYASQGHPTGLEAVLKSWGVGVMDDIVKDPHTVTGQDVVIGKEDFGKHPIVDSLSDSEMQVILPRPVINLFAVNAPANAPKVVELFGSSPGATLVVNQSEPPHPYPLAVAVEDQPVDGVTKPRGNTRIVVVGDSVFAGNHYIQQTANHDFLNAAINWLTDRPVLMAGIGPRPVSNFLLKMTVQQERQLSWLLLVVLPGGVLLLGVAVWLVRRK
jgi:hypothetical protein